MQKQRTAVGVPGASSGLEFAQPAAPSIDAVMDAATAFFTQSKKKTKKTISVCPCGREDCAATPRREIEVDA